MDFIALANINGYIRVGDPKNNRLKAVNRPGNGGLQDDEAVNPYVRGVFSVDVKPRSERGLSTSEKSMIFSEILRAAYENKANSHKIPR